MAGPTRDSLAEVEIWLLRPETAAPIDAELDVLVDDELDRASRYRSEDDRRAFIQRRAGLRHVLARYVGGSPGDVRLASTWSGRPVLADRRYPRFSLSHTRGLAVVAVSPTRWVGVDIERIRPIDDALDLARGLFAPSEASWLRSAPPDRRDERFLVLWTRKESYVKALGTGLSTSLSGFRVWASDTHGRGRPHGPSGPLPYAFSSLGGLDGFVGAVTAAGTRLDLRMATP